MEKVTDKINKTYASKKAFKIVILSLGSTKVGYI